MPVRVIQTGLPGATFDDSNGSPFMPALAQAGNTLLELGPKLAQIRMQQQAAERQQGNADRQFGLDQRRTDYEGQRIGADIRGQRARNIKDVIEMGGGNSVADMEDAQKLGWGKPLLAPMVSQANDRIAMQRAEGEAKNRLTNATADYTELKPDIEDEKMRINDERNKAAIHEKEAAREQALHVTAVKSVDSILADPVHPITQKYTMMVNSNPQAAEVFKKQLIEKQKAALDPDYSMRKLNALMSQGPR